MIDAHSQHVKLFSTCPTNEAYGIGILSGSHGWVETGKANHDVSLFHICLCFSEKPWSSSSLQLLQKYHNLLCKLFDQARLMEVHGYISNFTKFNNKHNFCFLFSFVALVMQRLRSCLFRG